MLVGFIVFEIMLAGVACAIGWTRQALKSPEERHLDWLIDTNDPTVTQYVRKHWPNDEIVVIDVQGRPFALI